MPGTLAEDELERLLSMMASDVKAVRVEAIGRLRAALPDVRQAMLAALSSADWRVRASATAVLDHAEQDQEIEAALRRAARDPDARVRDSAFHTLSCRHCKPDGCLADDSIGLLVDGLLHDPSVRVRRKIAGGLMWSQQGREALIVDGFRHILAVDGDRVLRERAATFLASGDVPRTEMPFREWLPAFERRKAELLAVGPSVPPGL